MANKFKKGFISCVVATAVGLSMFASACSLKTSHPNAKITVDFNNVSYEIEYTLYRNMYPRTVQHFIELADNGFYDNMIVHNYNTSSDWFTGAYSFNGYTAPEGESELTYESAYKNGANSLKDYLSKNSKEQAYYDLAKDVQKLTPTVFKRVAGNKVDEPLPTLIGEFSENDHKIENKALTAKTGSLKMFYYEKADPNKKTAIVTSSNQILEHDYKYNCATSIFSMQVGNSTQLSENKYCVFAEIKSSSADKLNELLKNIAEYIEDNGYSGKFTTSVTIGVDNLDEFSKAKAEVSFSVPAAPLIIKSVKITKY